MFRNLNRLELLFIRWIGTRGCVLLILGAIWTIIGAAFLANPIERFSKPGPGGYLDFLDEGPGVYIFSGMWLLGGTVAIVVAILRPTTCEDDLGFNGVGLPPLLWGFGYWWSWIVHLLFDGQYGRGNGYIGGLLYSTLSLLVIFLSHHVQDHPEGPCARRRASELR